MQAAKTFLQQMSHFRQVMSYWQFMQAQKNAYSSALFNLSHLFMSHKQILWSYKYQMSATTMVLIFSESAILSASYQPPTESRKPKRGKQSEKILSFQIGYNHTRKQKMITLCRTITFNWCNQFKTLCNTTNMFLVFSHS